MAVVRRWVWVLLFLMVVGCSGRPAPVAPAPVAGAGDPAPAPAGPVESPATAQPALDPAAAWDPCAPPGASQVALEVWGHFTARRMEPPGGCRFIVDTRQLQLSAPAVKAPTAAAAAQALQVTGATPLRPVSVSENGSGAWRLYLDLAPGAAGEQIAVTLTPAPGAAPITATLVRKAGPAPRVLLQGADSTWAPLRAGASLPPGPKRLRVEGGGAALEPKGIYYFGPGWQNQISPDRFERIAPDVVELEFQAPPPMLQIVVGGVDADGLRIADFSTHFYLGEPPVLELVAPKTGETTRVGAAPPEIYGAKVRPDGRYAVLTTLDPVSVEGYQDWLVDLQTGALTMLPFASSIDQRHPDFDARGRLVAPLDWGHIGLYDPAAGKATVQSSAALFWDAVSPDGRYIAGRDGAPFGRSTGAWVGPPLVYHLVIRNLTTDSELVLPWSGYAAGLWWLPDGRLVQMTVQSERPPFPPGPQAVPKCTVVDPVSGAVADYDGQCQYPHTEPTAYDPGEGRHFLTWLPDGRALVVRWPNWENQRRLLGP